MTATEAYSDLSESLTSIYENREAANIADWVIENITGKKGWERKLDTRDLTIEELTRFDKYKSELLTNKPVQYVLNEAWFCGMKFYVDENVLVPRPETEELVDIITKDHPAGTPMVIDIGSGSGCIPVSIKKKLPGARVVSCDISEGAVNVARKNARDLKADVEFQVLDFLNEINWSALPSADIIVSNPPYIPFDEKELLAKNVVDFEPSVALFVPQDDPLIFYKKILHFAGIHLRNGGKVYLEVHENLAGYVRDLFAVSADTVEIIKDMYGRERMIRAIWKY